MSEKSLTDHVQELDAAVTDLFDQDPLLWRLVHSTRDEMIRIHSKWAELEEEAESFKASLELHIATLNRGLQVASS